MYHLIPGAPQDALISRHSLNAVNATDTWFFFVVLVTALV